MRMKNMEDIQFIFFEVVQSLSKKRFAIFINIILFNEQFAIIQILLIVRSIACLVRTIRLVPLAAITKHF